MVLPTSYLPSIEYFSLLAQNDEASINIGEVYQKQSIRNRCFILSPNGVQCLVIPVHHSGRQLTKDIRISYAERWTQLHLRSIQTAYSGSPFYEYFSDNLHAIFEKRHEFLFELNQELTLYLIKSLHLKTNIGLSNNQNPISPPFNIKRKTHEAVTVKEMPSYNQVFAYKFGFVPNLSAIDLLFNVGNRSGTYLSSILRND